VDKRKSTKRQAMVHKTSHRQLEIEQQEQQNITQTTKDWATRTTKHHTDN